MSDIEKLEVPEGSLVVVAVALDPWPAEFAAKVAEIICLHPWVKFAYAPNILIPKVTEKCQQALVCVHELAEDRELVLVKELTKHLSKVLPPGRHMDVLPMRRGDALLSAVLETESVISINDELFHRGCLRANPPVG